MNKREFLVGTTFLGVAGLAGAASVRAAEGSEARTASVFNVAGFGAKGDGKTPDSEAIQKALDAAGAVSGTVYLPAGRYPCHDLKEEMTADLGDHGPEYLFANNVGCPITA
jgi:hypothetical protein